MISSLEHISFEAVSSPEQVSYSQFRKTLAPIYKKVWIHIGVGYLLLVLPFIATAFVSGLSNNWWLAPLFCLWFGYVLAYLHLFVHEAAHFNIHPDKKKNDTLASWLLCSLFALDIKKYRTTHWQHHLHLATPGDKEISYFNALTLSFILKVLTGLHTINIILHRKESNPSKKKDNTITGLLLFILVQLILCSLAFASGGYVMLCAWLVGLLLVFPFFATLRQILEHREDNAGNQKEYYNAPQNTISRLFGNDIASRTFGGAGFNRHLLHHWDPHISYTRLNDVFAFLSRAEATKAIVTEAQTSYLKAFRTLFFIR
ncbi:MAG: fatty acid desaturase [Chitinophagaceae bacterium]